LFKGGPKTIHFDKISQKREIPQSENLPQHYLIFDKILFQTLKKKLISSNLQLNLNLKKYFALKIFSQKKLCQKMREI
jgi:hypothetical protein